MTNPSFTQVTFRLRNDDGSETTATWKAAEGADATINSDVNFRCRFNIDETASRAWTSKTWNLYYSHNAGAYTAVSGTTPVQFSLSSQFADGADCTDQLSGGTGTFLTDNNGMKEATGGATNTGSAGNLFEVEWCLKFDPAQVADNDTMALRVYDGTSAIAAYTDTPLITISDLILNAEPKTFTISGGTATALMLNRLFNAEPRTFTYTGIAATFVRGVSMNAEPRAFVITASNPGHLFNRVINGEPKTFTISGVAATLARSRLFNAEPRAFTLSGVGPTLAWGRVFNAETGIYIYTGIDATLTYVPGGGPGSYNLNLEPASFLITASNTTNLHARLLNAELRAFTVSGVNPTNLAARILQATATTYVITGAEPSLFRGRFINAASGTFTVSGADATILATRILVATTGSYVFVWPDSSLLRGYLPLVADPYAFTLTGTDLGFLANRELHPDAGVYTLNTPAAEFIFNIVRKMVARVDKKEKFTVRFYRD